MHLVDRLQSSEGQTEKSNERGSKNLSFSSAHYLLESFSYLPVFNQNQSLSKFFDDLKHKQLL
jgi:hypothetical protein